MNYSRFVTRTEIQNSLFRNFRKPRLSHLDIELTERCNNACIHCYINLPATDAQADKRELNTDQWKDILRQATDLGALSVRFTGGEPLLREDFSELYLYTRKLGLKVILFTNARLITPEIVNLFCRVPLLKKIEVTVYGMREQSYDAVACSIGAYAEYRRGISLLLKKGIPFVVKSVLLPPNRLEIDEFENWASKLPWMNRSPSYSLLLDQRARRDSPQKNALIRKMRLSPQEVTAIFSRRSNDYYNGMFGFSRNHMYPQGDVLFDCGAGESGCVDAYGKYQMCMLLRHPDTVYDLNLGTMREALEVFFPKIRVLKATNPDYLRRCARCFLKGLCEQCPAKSWTEYGTLDTPVEYLCQVAHAQARYLGLINENENAWEVADWRDRIRRFSSDDRDVK